MKAARPASNDHRTGRRRPAAADVPVTPENPQSQI
jgi:hypothetical protein